MGEKNGKRRTKNGKGGWEEYGSLAKWLNGMIAH
jgi:hypothetical protein